MEVSFEIGRPKSSGGRILGVHGQGVGGLENWTIFMDVICVSSLRVQLFFPGNKLESKKIITEFLKIAKLFVASN